MYILCTSVQCLNLQMLFYCLSKMDHNQIQTLKNILKSFQTLLNKRHIGNITLIKNLSFFWKLSLFVKTKHFVCLFGWNCLNGSGEENFQILSMNFRYFVIISPWERTWPFIWKKNFTQACFVLCLFETGPVVLEKIFKFCLFRY